jgi:hypothetical protein
MIKTGFRFVSKLAGCMGRFPHLVTNLNLKVSITTLAQVLSFVNRLGWKQNQSSDWVGAILRHASSISYRRAGEGILETKAVYHHSPFPEGQCASFCASFSDGHLPFQPHVARVRVPAIYS